LESLFEDNLQTQILKLLNLMSEESSKVIKSQMSILLGDDYESFLSGFAHQIRSSYCENGADLKENICLFNEKMLV